METLIELSNQKERRIPKKFSRYLFPKIDKNDQLTGISGGRGTGKTTLLLQLMSENRTGKDSIYISLDHLYFSQNSLYEFAKSFNRLGGKYIYADEVHKYPNWSQELKNMYDDIPDLRVVFTSSSALQIHKGSHDLSRRARMLNLSGLSFREFLQMKYNFNLEPLTLDNILHHRIPEQMQPSKEFKPYQYFEEYIRTGYYPFALDGGSDFYGRLMATINLVLEYDLPSIEPIDYRSVAKIRKLLYLLAQMAPYKPNISALAAQIEVTRSYLIRYLDLLHRAQVIRLLNNDAFGITLLNKPEKVYLSNTNLFFALNQNSQNTGSLRETFFLNQMTQVHTVTYSDVSDFLVDNKYTFEIGGINKTKKQIKNIKNAFVVKDQLETGSSNVIPLWLFGMLY